MRRAFALIELVVVLATIGILTAVAAPRLYGWFDRYAVHRARAEVSAFYHAARFSAIMRSRRVRLEFTVDSLRATYVAATESPAFTRAGPARHGVTMTASRATITIGPTGLGWGAANTKLVFRRGAVAESLTTSRLGRLKRW